MFKGFCSKAKQNSPSERIKKQLKIFIAGNDFERNVVIFPTSLKRKKALAVAVNEVAQDHSNLHLQVFDNTDSLVAVISKIVKDEKGMSYTWVEQSKITGKWLVMASPPGAFDCRCLSVWRDRDKALEVENDINQRIRTMPIKDWESASGCYLEMIDVLPNDDDTFIGKVNPETGEVRMFDTQSQEKIEELLKRVVDGCPESKKYSLTAIKEFLID